jgi:S-DNA-T family DNA segregation ATPase FtsK/SpoIIIE
MTKRIKTGYKASGNLPTARLLLSVLRHPGLMGPLFGLGVAAWWLNRSGWAWPTVSTVFALVVLGVWRWRWPATFSHLVGLRLRAWGRRWFRYAPLWWFWMGRLGLSLTDEQTGWIVRPRLVKVVCSPCTDSLLIALPTGMVPDLVTTRCDELAHATRSRRAKTREAGPGRVWLDLDRTDPLVQMVSALPIPDRVDVADLDGLVIGRCEDGSPWRLKVRGNHVFVVGVTGAGKGSVIWSVLRALAPFVRAGLVEVHAIDPKGGMELEFGADLFSRYERDDHEAMVRLLEDDAAAMDTRARLLRGTTRTFTPSTATPFVLIVVDELITLTTLLPDRKLMARAEVALGSLLSKGRAPGYGVLAAAQDASKDVNRWRGLFPTKIALRLDEAIQVDMVLGEGVRDRGGYADRIPESLPGVGFVKVDGRRDPVRVRAAYVTDDQITAMSSDYRPLASAPLALADADTETGQAA